MPGGIPHQVPRAPFDVRRQIAVEDRELGYRAVQLLEFVRQHMNEHGRPPSYATIRDALGFSDKSDVGKCVSRLERRGLIQRTGPGTTSATKGKLWNQPVLRLC